MEDGRRMGYIKQQAVVRKKEGTGTSNPSTNSKPEDKIDHPPKKPKVMVGPVGVARIEIKLPPPFVHGKGKGLMMDQVPTDKKRPVLLHEDPQYAFKQLSFIITSEDYEDLDNHSNEAMEETSLFSLA